MTTSTRAICPCIRTMQPHVSYKPPCKHQHSNYTFVWSVEISGSNCCPASTDCLFFASRIVVSFLLYTMFARDLVAERDLVMEARLAALTTEMPAEPPFKRRLTKTDSINFDDVVAVIALTQFDPVSHATLCVDISAVLGDKLVASKRHESCATVQNRLGLYFNTGGTVDDRPVWKQIEAPVGMPTMYIFGVRNGWYCSSTIFQFDSDVKYLEPKPVISFWACSDPDSSQDWPNGDVHSPYWSSYTNSEFSVKLGHSMLYETAADLKMLHSAVEEKDKADASSASSSTLVCKAKGKGGHGGWMPRAASLAAALYENNIVKGVALSDEYCGLSSAFKALVKRE